MKPQRIEQDSMGDMPVPADAYFGAQTARAAENFPISAMRFSRRFIQALGLIKWAAAKVNAELGMVDEPRAGWIIQAAAEVRAGKLDDQFVLDIFQTGSGTSTNMNANEVIAGRANELAGKPRGGRDPVHPNDHVNWQQSSNDVIPSAMHIAAALAIKQLLLPALDQLADALEERAAATGKVLKIGRTHLQDATPLTLGQELSGYARQVRLAGNRADRAIHALHELALGGTAVGTGLNADPRFASKVIQIIAQQTGIEFVEAVNHFEAQGAKDAVVETSGLLRSIAISLSKIANDVRLLASGPRCGLGEITLPATQPGSSIMPGKINPVMSEMLMQVGAQVIGNDASIAWCASLGSALELNVMMPLMAHNLIQSIELLAAGARVFAARCAAGIAANELRCAQWVEQSLALVTALVPKIGYDRAAQVAKQAAASGQTVRQVAREMNLMPQQELDKLLDVESMEK